MATLLKGEETLLVVRRPLFAGLLSAVFTLGLGWIHYRQYRMELTNKRLIMHEGFFGLQERAVRLEHILDVTVGGGSLNIALGCGDLIVQTAGSGFVMKNVAGARRMRDAIMAAQQALLETVQREAK